MHSHQLTYQRENDSENRQKRKTELNRTEQNMKIRYFINSKDSTRSFQTSLHNRRFAFERHEKHKQTPFRYFKRTKTKTKKKINFYMKREKIKKLKRRNEILNR